VEAEGNEVPLGADGLALPGGAHGLGGVLDDPQRVALGDGVEPIPIHGQPGQIHRDNGLGAGGDGGFQPVQIQIAGVRRHIHEDGPGPHVENDVGRGHPGQGRGNALVPGADTGQLQGDFQGNGAGAEHPHGAAAKIAGQGGFQFGALGAGGNPAGAEDLPYGGNGGLVDGGAGKRQEISGHGLAWLPSSPGAPSGSGGRGNGRTGKSSGFCHQKDADDNDPDAQELGGRQGFAEPLPGDQGIDHVADGEHGVGHGHGYPGEGHDPYHHANYVAAQAPHDVGFEGQL